MVRTVKVSPHATNDEIADALIAASALLGLRLGAEQLAALAESVAGEGWTAHQAGAVCRHLTRSPEISGEIRRYGTIVPADLLSAFKELYPDSAVSAPRRFAGYDDEQTRQAERQGGYWGLASAERTTKAERDRRLREGTDAAKPGTPEYLRGWDRYYKSDYVNEAREKARAMLENPGTCDQEDYLP